MGMLTRHPRNSQRGVDLARLSDKSLKDKNCVERETVPRKIKENTAYIGHGSQQTNSPSSFFRFLKKDGFFLADFRYCERRVFVWGGGGGKLEGSKTKRRPRLEESSFQKQ